MPPTLILVRHAQAEHNATKDYFIHDPDLTQLGREQCAELREGLMQHPLAQQAELIITSPMRRTIQTTLDSVDWLIEKGVKVQADALWQENSAKPCDTGSEISKVAEEFPSIDYSTVDPVYPDKSTPAGSKYHFTKATIVARGQAALQSLYERPEKVIIVVSHSGFLRRGVTGSWFFNADYRIFDFAAMASAGSPYRLEQHASTKENGGGLGYSWTEEVIVGSDLPDEIPSAEDSFH
ncbi:phosphoglycerate mutase-like protein [Astrocystis sublimbata]|nr:phosphoglycerate mutase-like protein [Astrocystis sublimbata]